MEMSIAQNLNANGHEFLSKGNFENSNGQAIVMLHIILERTMGKLSEKNWVLNILLTAFALCSLKLDMTGY